jgi:hypothetical protein
MVFLLKVILSWAVRGLFVDERTFLNLKLTSYLMGAFLLLIRGNFNSIVLCVFILLTLQSSFSSFTLFI